MGVFSSSLDVLVQWPYSEVSSVRVRMDCGFDRRAEIETDQSVSLKKLFLYQEQINKQNTGNFDCIKAINI